MSDDARELTRRVIAALTTGRGSDGPLPLVDAVDLFHANDEPDDDDASGPSSAAARDVAMARRLTGAFLLALGGGEQTDAAHAALRVIAGEWSEVGAFYRDGLTAVPDEIARRHDEDPSVAEALHAAAALVDDSPDDLTSTRVAEHLWRVLFPEGVGILGHEAEREEALRRERIVTVDHPPDAPITDPATELLLTANALLTTPLAARDPAELQVAEHIAVAARAADDDEQRYYYDHPIPVGIRPEANEIVYGLRHLDHAIGFEQRHGTVPDGTRMPCVLSVSVTHLDLRDVARDYVADVIERAGGLRHLDVHVVAEDDTTRLVDEVLAPAARRFLGRDDTDLLDVVGVDGRYGRHYSFLKAVAAVWHVLIDDRVRATFKIDLDQIFPQQALVDETGASALEHLTTPLWGAAGSGAHGAVELGMLAGALVNERDFATSLFTPDVTYPAGPNAPPDHVFFSRLPQALSTAAEMGTRYADGRPDGQATVVERVHVTGGTTGARVDALRRHRPFTPSFIARAEDQAYVLATYGSTPRLGYLHADGLIMRHDKEAFAGEAIEAAAIGKLIGDHVRILLFSAYGSALGDAAELKTVIDPFTGCFVSATPTATVYLRFALQAAALLASDRPDDGVAFVRDGSRQLRETLRFIDGDPSELQRTVDREWRGWKLFYDVLDALERALADGDQQAVDFAAAARRIIDATVIG